VGIVVVAVLAALVGAAFLANAALRRETPQVEFLQQALGEPAAAAPLTRKPDAATVVRLHENGYSLDRGALSVGLRSVDSGAGDLERHSNGVSRRTGYGWEAVTVTPTKTEQFLTVVDRQGPKTWRWQLKSLNLTPRVGDDGAVGFIRNGRLMSDVAYIEPVRILDAHGRDITPSDLRWSVAARNGGWWLELDLDDAELPLPYVIDPAIALRSVGTSTAGGAALFQVIPIPAGVVDGDLLVAQVTTKANATITSITAQPSGGGAFTSIDRRATAGNEIGQEVFWRSASSEPATSYTFNFSASVKASGGIAAYTDVANQANPINAVNGQANASSVTATAPQITTTVANTRLLTLVGSDTGNAGTTNWSGLTNERWDLSSSGGGANSRTSTGLGDEAFVGPGLSPARTGTNVTAAVNIGQSVALAPLAADGSGTQASTTTNVAASSTGNTVVFTYTAAAGGMRNGTVNLTVPAGWSAPSLTTNAAGYTTASTGVVGVAGQVITVTGVTLLAAGTLTITYGATGGGGPGATATATTGAQTWQSQQRSSSISGALTNLGASPSITVNAANGSGTLTTPTASVPA
jgi:hypothetical protein